MNDYIIFDAHCDTVSEMSDKNLDITTDKLHWNLQTVKEFKGYIQVFAAFVDKHSTSMSPLNRCLKLIEKYYTEIDDRGDIHHCTTGSEIEKSLRENKCASFLAVEGGEALEGNISAVSALYRLGVRLITLTWNYANEIADGALEGRGGGLTDFGKDVVKRMNELHMLVDVSHLSEAGFWDVVKLTSAPIIASHSNAYKVCAHPRNLKDDQIRAIIKVGGGIGINFYPDFLTNSNCASVKDIVKHIRHMFEIGACKCVGIGADFDGVDYLPDGMFSNEGILSLIDALKADGFSETEIKDITSSNFLRLFKQVLG